GKRQRSHESGASALCRALVSGGESLGVLEAAFLFRLPLAGPLRLRRSRRLFLGAALGEIGAVRRIEPGGNVGALVERLRLSEPFTLMREPGRRARIGIPIAGAALDPLKRRQPGKILREPALQQPPLTQQRLMRRLDRRDARIGRDIGRKQPFLDEEIDEWPCLFWDIGAPGDVAARALGIGIDAGEPGNETTAQKRQPRLALALARNARIGVRRLQGPRDRLFDGALDAAETFIIGKTQGSSGTIFSI